MPFQNIPREKVMAVIDKVGPVQPLDLYRELHEGDTVLMGAILSEMAASQMVAISKTKRGGSPFYYNPKKPETLEKVAQFLGEKDRRTFAYLQEQKVLREDALEPLTRVSLQNIPDFSRRLLIGEIPYWRYFLVSEEEAKRMVGGAAPAAPAKAEQKKEAPAAEAKKETPQKAEVKKEPAAAEAKPIEKQETLAAEEKPKKARKPRAKRAPSAKAVKKFPEPVERQEPAMMGSVSDKLLEKVHAFAQSQHGLITNSQIVKKDVEITCTLTVPGHFGNVSFSVAATTKKLAEKQVMQWLLQAKPQGMPLLVLSTEPIPKKLETTFEGTANVNFKRL